MESLGIELKLLIGQIVNFLILFVLLSFFLYKPIVRILEERRAKIARSLDEAKKIEEKLAATETQTQEIIGKARQEAGRIITETQKSVQIQKKEILESAKTQSDKIILAAQKEAKESQNKIVAEAKKEMAELVGLALEKVVKSLSEEDKKRLSQKAIEEIK